jgi:universal stress protein A
MYKHILFATELHDSKKYIEDKVAQLQQFTDAKLSIIHVVEPIPNYGGALGVVPSPDPVGSFGNTEKLKEQAKEILQPLAKRLNITEQHLWIY